jgi:heterodisulfide reductase subunit A-like polyferredoxin
LKKSDRFKFQALVRLKKINGSPGNFEAVIEKAPRYIREDACNACGICTTVCPIDIPMWTDAVQDLPPLSPAKGIATLVQTNRKAIHPNVPMPFPTAFVIERNRCPADCRRCETVCPTRAVVLDQQPAEETIRFGAAIVTTGWDPYPLFQVSEYGYGKHVRVIGNLEFEQVLGLCEENLNFITRLPIQNLREVGFVQCAGSRDERHLSYCSSVCCSATLKQINHLKKFGGHPLLCFLPRYPLPRF